MENNEVPLISIVALFYNQRDYVCETARSLFAQTYENCEIILSDDCSTDGTGAMLEKLAADYRGPHKVIVNINETNLGIGNHCKKVFSMCHGEWIVMCGGDDSSAPDRVKHVVAYAGEYPDVVAIGCSSVEVETGAHGECATEKPLVDRPTVYPKYVGGDFSYELSPRHRAPMCFIAGALAAWRRRVVDLVPFPDGVAAEDVVLSLRASLLGDMLFIPEMDVRRRVGGVSLKRRRQLLRAQRRAHRRFGAVMCFRSEYAVLKECEGYPFQVSSEFKEKIWNDSALALVKCMDLPLSEMSLYSAALCQALRTQGLFKCIKMAFSAGRLRAFLKMVLKASVTRRRDDKIVMRVDGGLCSQIAFVALGLDLADRGNKVLFDLSWFRDCGKDSDGKFVRNWDMPKAFPELPLSIADDATVGIYKKRHSQRGSDLRAFKAPLYIGGYPDRMASLLKQRGLLQIRFKPELDDRRRTLLPEIESRPSCAVHVRRGDLAKTNYAYGEPTSVRYYRRAVEIVRGLAPGARYYFFSDEPRWVRDVLVPALGDIENTIVSEDNESDKGYMDLFLISRADYIISSIGSLGVYGAILSGKCKALIMSKYDRDVFENLADVICVSGDKSYAYQDLTVKKHGVFKPLYSLWKIFGHIIGAPDIRRFSHKS